MFICFSEPRSQAINRQHQVQPISRGMMYLKLIRSLNKTRPPLSYIRQGPDSTGQWATCSLLIVLHLGGSPGCSSESPAFPIWRCASEIPQGVYLKVNPSFLHLQRYALETPWAGTPKTGEAQSCMGTTGVHRIKPSSNRSTCLEQVESIGSSGLPTLLCHKAKRHLP